VKPLLDFSQVRAAFFMLPAALLSAPLSPLRLSAIFALTHVARLLENFKM
jgi:hypothetical protein